MEWKSGFCFWSRVRLLITFILDLKKKDLLFRNWDYPINCKIFDSNKYSTRNLNLATF